jgi:drug/metabolite transporter (DMT)-like permease
VRSDLAALAAVVMWASLATLASILSHIPPLLLTGLGLLIGSAISLPLSGFKIKKIWPKPQVLLLGVYGLFGYHAALFAGLQNAPEVQANLVNYLWPLLIVILAPLIVKGTTLRPRHIIAAVTGFVGAAMAIVSGSQLTGGFEIGYVYALLAALLWSTYSLGIRAIGSFSVPAVGAFGLVAGALAIGAHFIFEPRVEITPSDLVPLALLGLGALGASFYFWAYALQNGEPQRIGLIAFLTPVVSTVMLILWTGSALSPLLLLSATLIFVAAWFGGRGDN